MTPSSLSITTTAVKSHNLKLAMAVLGSFLAGISLMLILRNSDSRVASSRALPASSAPGRPPIEPAPAASPAVPQSATKQPPIAPEQAERPPPQASRPAKSPARTARSPLPIKEPVVAAPEPPPSPTPKPPSREALLASAMALKKRAEQNGRTDMASKLGSIANDLMLGKEPTGADISVIRGAERDLP